MRNYNEGCSKVILSDIARAAKAGRSNNVGYRYQRPVRATLADTADGHRLMIETHKRIDERAKALRELANRVLVHQLNCWTLWEASLKHLYDIARDEKECSRVSMDLKYVEAGSSQAFESVCYALTGDCNDRLWDGWLKHQQSR